MTLCVSSPQTLPIKALIFEACGKHVAIPLWRIEELHVASSSQKLLPSTTPDICGLLPVRNRDVPVANLEHFLGSPQVGLASAYIILAPPAMADPLALRADAVEDVLDLYPPNELAQEDVPPLLTPITHDDKRILWLSTAALYDHFAHVVTSHPKATHPA